MISEEDIEASYFSFQPLCIVCKNIIKVNAVYYRLSKNIEQDDELRAFNTKNSRRCRVRFCEDCWKEVAGEQYEMEGTLK